MTVTLTPETSSDAFRDTSAVSVSALQNMDQVGIWSNHAKMISGRMCHCYRPQRSWGKVMFLQASVILSTEGGVPDQVLPHPGPARYTPPPGPARYNPQTRYTPQGQVPPRPGTPPPPDRYTHPPTRYTPPPPGAEHAGRCGQCAGGTHPTGMQSCFI